MTKSSPMGSVDSPFNPISLALGAEATFVARTIDSDRKHLHRCCGPPPTHKGTAFVEIYQNCNIFNDGAFDVLKDPNIRTTARSGWSTASRSASARTGEGASCARASGGFGRRVA